MKVQQKTVLLLIPVHSSFHEYLSTEVATRVQKMITGMSEPQEFYDCSVFIREVLSRLKLCYHTLWGLDAKMLSLDPRFHPHSNHTKLVL